MNERRPLELRHKGAQEGRGIKAWGTDEQARFDLQGNANNPNARALLLVDYARKHDLLLDEELKKINLTTLTRYLSNRVVRHTLGIADAKYLQITAPIPEFERVLVRFLRDSLGENPQVHSRSSATEREAYAETLRKDGAAPEKRDMTPYQPRVEQPLIEDKLPSPPYAHPSLPDAAELPTDDSPKHDALAGGPPLDDEASEVPTQRDNRSFDKRKFVIKSDFSVRITDPALKRLYDELKKLEAAEFAFSSVYLLRSVIEKGTAVYLKRRSITPKRELHEKLAQLADQLKIDGMSDRELKILRTISVNGRDDPYSPDTLGHYIHGGAIPEKTYALRYWDTLEKIMRHVLHDPK